MDAQDGGCSVANPCEAGDGTAAWSACRLPCRRGWAAEDVYDHLQDEEFAQVGSGGTAWCFFADVCLQAFWKLGSVWKLPNPTPSNQLLLLLHLNAWEPLLPPRAAKHASLCRSFPPLCLQSGGLVINVARVPGSFNVTAAMFGRWLSVVYMTMVQLGVVFAGG